VFNWLTLFGLGGTKSHDYATCGAIDQFFHICYKVALARFEPY
jgi:hypothetical protein